MISLRKLNAPDILVRNKEYWDEQYEKYRNGEDVPRNIKTKYRKPEIKDVIKIETHDKCAYCECKVPHSQPGDIEHIVPKSVDPTLIFDWENLTLSCRTCNHSKHTYYDPEVPLINPYRHNPEDHLEATGPLVLAKTRDNIGETAQTILRLNRNALLEQRAERILKVKKLIDHYLSEDDKTRKRLLKIQLLQETEPDKEFSFVIKKFIALKTDIDLDDEKRKIKN